LKNSFLVLLLICLFVGLSSLPARCSAKSGKTAVPAREGGAASTAPAESGDCLEDSECRRVFESARRLSDSQQYNAALTGYQNAYALRPSPWLLINIGRVQQKMGRPADAVASFQRFLNQPGTQAEEAVAAAREYLKQAESDLAAQKEKEQRQAQSLSATPAESKPVYKRWWFWLLIGGTAAVAATAVGVGVGVSASSAGSAGEPARAPFHIAF
jgi:tetratricopeptide (TPR) repeat protein